MTQTLAGWVGTALVLLLAGCATPAERLHADAGKWGLQTLAMQGGGFQLTGFYRAGSGSASALHVYLEGDGQPWQQGIVPAADPTTRDSLMLPLMALDAAPVLYLGRPCYNGHANDPGCHPRLWTHARYGSLVVDAMREALQAFMERYDHRQVVLIGHSGGGALAMLLAAQLSQTLAVVTLAGNYDIDAWADFHGYQRLNESFNPADHANTGISEWHFLGEQDRTVPPELFFPALQRRANSHVVRLAGVDHRQGWREQWPHILARLPQGQ